MATVASGAVIQQSPPSTKPLPADNEVIGGHFGLVNIVNTVANFIGGFDRPKGDEAGFVDDLKTIFPSLKTSGFGSLLSTVFSFHNISTFIPGLKGLSAPKAAGSSANVDAIKAIVSKGKDI